MASLAFFFLMLFSRYTVWDRPILPPVSKLGGFLRLILPSAAALISLGLDGWLARFKPISKTSSWRRVGLGLLEILTVAVALSCIFVRPANWAWMAGRNIFLDDACHHWNYFVMGPALAYRGGGALGTDIYSQYSIGWPWLCATLDRYFPMSYARMIGMGIICACMYYAAFYILLRWLVRSWAAAAAGLLLGILIALYSGIPYPCILWTYPMHTIMRRPTDACFLLVLLAYYRSGRVFWLWIAGGITGIALFFELDTGVLHIPVVAYLLFFTVLPKHRDWKIVRHCLLGFAAYLLVMTLTLMPLLVSASRGTCFSQQFWNGLTEGMRLQAGLGINFIPMAEVDVIHSLLFLGVMVTYLVFAVVPLLKWAAGRRFSDDLFPGGVAVLGLMSLTYFIGHSHPGHLYRGLEPFVLLLTLAWARFWIWLRPWMPRTSVPVMAVVVLLLFMLTKPEFQDCPTLAGSLLVAPRAGDLAMCDDPTDLVVERTDDNLKLKKVLSDLSTAMRQQADNGHTLAVFDNKDAFFYYLAHVRPWSRYSPLSDEIVAKQQVADITEELRSRRPEFVVLATSVKQVGDGTDLWIAVAPIVKERYDLQGQFENMVMMKLRP